MKSDHARPLLLTGALFTSIVGTNAQPWDQYGGPGGQQYSPLDQINSENVVNLEQTWVYRTGDLNQGFRYKQHSLQTNPVIWNDTLYFSTGSNWVIALDAGSGQELWRFEPTLPKGIGYSENASRGVSLWHGDSGTCPDRLFIGTHTGLVWALDALDGKPCQDFGDNGVVDLKPGAESARGEVELGDYGVTSPPAILGDSIIVGSAVGDNRAVELEKGIVRALDARTGAVRWLWDPIPRDRSDPAFDTWGSGSALITGAANAWTPISADSENNLVFVSTSSPSPDFYGGQRLGENRYANSLVALDGDSGEVSWHQQLVHHDVWDYDIPSQPTLTRMDTPDGPQPAVVVVTKTGMLYAFHRQTGEPLIGIEERPVPDTDVPGERLSPTQPFSTLPPLAEQRALTASDAFGVLFFDWLSCRSAFNSYRSEGIFTPPSISGTVQYPSYAGGSNWGGVAIDPQRQIAVTNVNQIPTVVKLIPRDELQTQLDSGELDGWEVSRQAGTPFAMARKIQLSPLGLPCNKPPWGKLVAVDLANQDILWEQPFGTIRDLAPGFVPNLNLGVPNMGGPMLTASGLLVIGAAAEHTLRIFDTETGELLWDTRLPVAANAVPMSYEVDGEQYIAIAAGGYDNLDLERGDYLIAFKLSE